MSIEVIELLSNLVTALKEIMLIATPLYGGYVVAKLTREQDAKIELQKNKQNVGLEIEKDFRQRKIAVYENLRIDYARFRDRTRDFDAQEDECWEDVRGRFLDAVELAENDLIQIKNQYLGKVDKEVMDKVYEILGELSKKKWDEALSDPKCIEEFRAQQDWLGEKYADRISDLIVELDKLVDKKIKIQMETSK